MIARCFKVTVATTSALQDTTYGANLDYVKCENEILYVFGEQFSDVAKVVHPAKIKKIENVGIGYVAE